jgi:glutamate dehydrogenase (NAD(P)+)
MRFRPRPVLVGRLRHPGACRTGTADHRSQRHHIKAKIILEGANGPTTPAADDILRDKGVLIVPDVIANAGGVTVSYFEWVQDFSSFFWTEDEINLRLTRIMREAFAAVWQLAEEKNVSLRTAAFIVACTRVLQAREMRGLYPDAVMR